ncbi:hypothetical protein FINN_58 [Bacillus phage Finn]|uniref:Uncharacterized protein n=1 Tax=Bacillus phage Finn TaxID=2884419 RepID=M1IEZ7_9CAUD|nr:hypothetical protein FINN_58 [Bacillus phage Finn]AGE61051.1 hypothetical protein FINN_58 [Bacillus phage Finn]
MLYLNAKEFEEMENLRWICNGKPHKAVIHLVLHSGEIANQYSCLDRFHKYDILGAVLTGEYQKAPTAKELLKEHQNSVQSGQSLVYSLQSFYTDLKKYGLIKEEN